MPLAIVAVVAMFLAFLSVGVPPKEAEIIIYISPPPTVEDNSITLPVRKPKPAKAAAKVRSHSHRQVVKKVYQPKRPFFDRLFGAK